MDKATFEIDLDTQSYYVTRKHNNIIEYQYLRFFFMSGQSNIDI